MVLQNFSTILWHLYGSYACQVSSQLLIFNFVWGNLFGFLCRWHPKNIIWLNGTKKITPTTRITWWFRWSKKAIGECITSNTAKTDLRVASNFKLYIFVLMYNAMVNIHHRKLQTCLSTQFVSCNGQNALTILCDFFYQEHL